MLGGGIGVIKRGSKVTVIGLALPIRIWAQRFALLGFLSLSFALVIFSRSDWTGIQQFRVTIVDTVSPILYVLNQPVEALSNATNAVEGFFSIYTDNQRLREENARLLQWVHEARRLGLENATLRAQLAYVPDKRTHFVTARVVADTGGTFFQSILINAGAREYVRLGQAVVWHGGLVGRIVEVGERTSRVLLMIDINSRIPVMIQSTGDRAILKGNNSSQPRLEFLPGNSPISPGDWVVTSGHGGVYPPGIAVGAVSQISDGVITLQPMVEWSKLSQAIILDFGVNGIIPPPERLPASSKLLKK